MVKSEMIRTAYLTRVHVCIYYNTCRSIPPLSLTFPLSLSLPISFLLTSLRINDT